MASLIVFCSGKKEFCVGIEVVDSVPVSSFIRSTDGSNKFFNEFFKIGKVNVKPLLEQTYTQFSIRAPNIGFKTVHCFSHPV